jgi:hypothetical protein
LQGKAVLGKGAAFERTEDQNDYENANESKGLFKQRPSCAFTRTKELMFDFNDATALPLKKRHKSHEY